MACESTGAPPHKNPFAYAYMHAHVTRYTHRGRLPPFICHFLWRDSTQQQAPSAAAAAAAAARQPGSQSQLSNTPHPPQAIPLPLRTHAWPQHSSARASQLQCRGVHAFPLISPCSCLRPCVWLCALEPGACMCGHGCGRFCLGYGCDPYPSFSLRCLALCTWPSVYMLVYMCVCVGGWVCLASVGVCCILTIFLALCM
jgi:hypothetical protein